MDEMLSARSARGVYTGSSYILYPSHVTGVTVIGSNDYNSESLCSHLSSPTPSDGPLLLLAVLLPPPHLLYD